jgi:hypothetical protein
MLNQIDEYSKERNLTRNNIQQHPSLLSTHPSQTDRRETTLSDLVGLGTKGEGPKTVPLSTKKHSCLTTNLQSIDPSPVDPNTYYLQSTPHYLLRFFCTPKGEDKQSGRPGLKVATIADSSSDLNSILDAVEVAKKEGADIFVGPEWSFMEIHPDPYSPRETRQILEKLRAASKGSKMLIVPGTLMVYTASGRLYNLLPIFGDGKLMYSYIKRTDGGSKDYNLQRYKLQFGKKSGVFTYGGLKFGVEVCRDAFACGLYERGVRNLDVQILSSAGNSYTTAAINDSGITICVDGKCSRVTNANIKQT